MKSPGQNLLLKPVQTVKPVTQSSSDERGGGGKTQLKKQKAHNLALSQVSDKTKVFTQLK